MEGFYCSYPESKPSVCLLRLCLSPRSSILVDAEFLGGARRNKQEGGRAQCLSEINSTSSVRPISRTRFPRVPPCSCWQLQTTSQKCLVIDWRTRNFEFQFGHIIVALAHPATLPPRAPETYRRARPRARARGARKGAGEGGKTPPPPPRSWTRPWRATGGTGRPPTPRR